jgi:hypothetical protein
MIVIAHRGNLVGPNPLAENNPVYLQAALDAGFDIETDVWSLDGKFMLGHDRPQYEVTREFLVGDRIWCHAKSTSTLYHLLEIGAHCFFHDTDECTLTSKGYIWTYPGKILTDKSIMVMPEVEISSTLFYACGVCSDYPSEWQDKLQRAK